MAEVIERNNRKERVGVVVSAAMDKTIVVAIKDKAKQCGVGDTVLVAETRHLSKDKCWRLVEIVEKAK